MDTLPEPETGPLEEHLLICCGLSGSAPVDGQVRGGDAYGGKSSGEGDEEEDGHCFCGCSGNNCPDLGHWQEGGGTVMNSTQSYGRGCREVNSSEKLPQSATLL
jgi:hypothetical protein